MTAPRNPDDLIRAFLGEGETDLPDRAFDAIRSGIHTTHQRVVIVPWRYPDMSIFARVAMAAVAVLAVGLAWFNLGPGQPGFGAQSTPLLSPTPTTTATPSPSPQTLPYAGAIEPGRYWLNLVGAPNGTPLPQVSLTLPAGWTSEQGLFIDKNYEPTDAGAGAAFVAWQISGTFVNPCTDHTLVEPTPGPGIDALADALAHQPGTTAGPATAVTVDGYSGKFVEVTVTADITKCTGDFWIWASPDGDRRYAQGTNEMNRMYILDVDGQRFTFNARIPARTTAADRAELETILESIEIEPAS